MAAAQVSCRRSFFIDDILGKKTSKTKPAEPKTLASPGGVARWTGCTPPSPDRPYLPLDTLPYPCCPEIPRNRAATQAMLGHYLFPAPPPPPSLFSFHNLHDVTIPVPLPVYVRTRSPNGTDLTKPKKCRRSRTVFSELQLMGLEKKFENQKYLSTSDRIDLAETLGLSQIQVKTWYQNRRMKWKKQVLQCGGTEPPTKPKGRPKKDTNLHKSEENNEEVEGVCEHHDVMNTNETDEDSDILEHCDSDVEVVTCS